MKTSGKDAKNWTWHQIHFSRPSFLYVYVVNLTIPRQAITIDNGATAAVFKKIVDDDNYHVLFKKKSNSRKRTNKEESTRKGVFYFGPQNGLWCEAMIKLYALSKNLIPFLPHLQLTYLVAIIVTKYWIMSYQ